MPTFGEYSPPSDNLFNLANAGASGTGQQNSQNAIDNNRLTSEYGADRRAQNLANFWNVVGSGNWGGTTNETKTATETPSTWSTIGSALGIGSSLWKLSDARFKTDVRCIGRAHNGLPLYAFRYISDPQGEMHIGYIAQEVEKTRPEAVGYVDGVMFVNIEKASI